MIRLCLKTGFIYILAMLYSSAWAEVYDPLLLRAQASIFPKIVLLDKNLAKKTTNNEIALNIVAISQDEIAAHQLRVYIEEKYKNKLGNRKLTVKITTFDTFNKESLDTAYIVLQGSETLFKKVVSYASDYKRIVFSYSYTDFRHDSLISLLVKEKTYIYLNKAAVKLYGIRFLPVFYKITKIIE